MASRDIKDFLKVKDGTSNGLPERESTFIARAGYNKESAKFCTFVRITLSDDTGATREYISGTLAGMFEQGKGFYVVGWEGQDKHKKTKPHCHIVGFPGEDLVSHLKIRSPNFKGNGCYSIKDLMFGEQHLKRALMYCVKDNDYECAGIDRGFIDELARASFKKNDTFGDELAIIRADFINDKYDIEQAVAKYLNLLAEYNQRVSLPRVREVITSWWIKKDPTRSVQIAHNVVADMVYIDRNGPDF